MKHELLSRGGRYNVRRTGRDEYTMDLPMPSDEQGMTARECPEPACAPGHFKIVFGTGIDDPNYDECYCPYCHREGDQSDFQTSPQQRYTESLLLNEMEAGVERMMRDSLGLNSRGRRKIGG